ncbi:hypothetical protein AYO20_09099 [Fonsecaea nubica]|uniref:3-oxoacyl-[acyl-carrier-protein] reductase n=1 Tax=Fonsecaea nubica TaxID=856822 RepID=A0A178CL25_9EURO|nr:hypothetical protein AYO20_09099 [Fonsecaea nubica]OAL29715.1 hypothetical protein AYO20_09099 [Fonsecaea nubica]
MVVAIVTGSSRGIGRAIALQLADDGMDVALNDIEAQLPQLQAVQAEIEQKGRKTSTFVADVSNEEQVEKMVADVVSEFGELNVMVANAGVLVPKSIMEVSVAEWDRVQSTSGHSVAYSTSKWAVRGLTQSAALEFAKYDINMWKQIDASIAEREGLEPGVAFKRSIESRTALKRAQEPADIANLVSFLVSSKARNITGQSVLCDGATVSRVLVSKEAFLANVGLSRDCILLIQARIHDTRETGREGGQWS